MCYGSCLATVGVGGFIGGAAVLTALGFSPGGIVVGSWAAKWIAPYAGKWKSYDSVVKICTTLCTASDYFDSRDEDSE